MFGHRCGCTLVRYVLASTNRHLLFSKPCQRPYSMRSFTNRLFPSTMTMASEKLLTDKIISKRYISKKAKNKKKSSTSSKASQFDTSVGDGVIDLNELNNEMISAVDKLRDDFKRKYSTNLTIGSVDNFFVTVDGKSLKLMEVAVVNQHEKEFQITPMLKTKNIEKGILESIEATGLSLNPRLHEGIISFTVPTATTEFKETLMKLSKSAVEKTKVSLRKSRQHALSQLKRQKDSLSKDGLRHIEKQIDLLTESSAQQIDTLFKEKTKELK